MPSPDDFAARLLDASAPGFATLATERVLERNPALGERLGTRPFATLRDSILGRLRDLSVAVSAGQPALFAEQVAWTRRFFEVRQASDDVLQESLRCMRDVLHSELPAGARESITGCLDSALEGLDGSGVAAESRLGADTPHGRLASRYLLALLEGDRLAARRLVMDGVTAGELSVSDAVETVCLPAQAELGRMWHLGEISVAEEHFVSATTVMLLAQLAALGQRRAPNGRTVLAAALGDDLHDIGLRAVSDLLELDGWRVVFLGAAVPVEDFLQAVDDFGADLVLLSASLLVHRQGVKDVVAALNARTGETPRPRILIGGPAYAQDDTALLEGADGCASSAHGAVALARELVPPVDAAAS